MAEPIDVKCRGVKRIGCFYLFKSPSGLLTDVSPFKVLKSPS
jgi:hypothetical protein